MPISYFAGSQAADDEPCAMDALPKVRFASDSPLEEGGFELYGAFPVKWWFCSPGPRIGVPKACPSKPDQQFESAFLQRRVCELSVPDTRPAQGAGGKWIRTFGSAPHALSRHAEARIDVGFSSAEGPRDLLG